MKMVNSKERYNIREISTDELSLKKMIEIEKILEVDFLFMDIKDLGFFCNLSKPELLLFKDNDDFALFQAGVLLYIAAKRFKNDCLNNLNIPLKNFEMLDEYSEIIDKKLQRTRSK